MKVTLLGDSIRLLGYGKRVPELLGEEFDVFQPQDNCRFAKYTLRGLFEWKSDMAGSKIVHWNNGLWDVCDIFGDGKRFTSEQEYTENILRIADLLLSKHDKVIFATTTPVTDKNPYNQNSVIERYNGIIVPLLEKKGVIINDLYATVSKDIDRFIRSDDNIHLTDDGIDICAAQVCEVIIKTAEALKK